MLTTILDVSWPIISPVGTMAVIVALVVRGHLLPRSWVNNLLAEKDARLEYQETAMTEQRATIASLVQQNAELTVSGRLSVALLQTIQPPPTISANNTDPGSGHVAATSVES